MSLRSIFLATATLCSYANAHITMTQPIPYSVDKIDSAPITKDQFPCKSNLGFTISQMNTMAVGQQQTIKFKGTAVHGGGSCQLSVTTDTKPTENSVFKVIKSIEGGCPGVDGQVNEYQFEIPDSVPSGNATFAWTWFSKMSGAPELYMNCAPIEVTGGASDTSKFDALPDMLKANIGEGCTTAQNFATKFPNPGAVVEEGKTNDQKPPTGSCGASGSSPQPSGGAGSPASSAAGGQPSAAPSSAGGNNGQYTPPAGAGATSAAATSAAAYPTGPAGGASGAASATSEAAVTSAATSAAAYPTGSADGASDAVTSAAATGGAGGVFAPGASSAAPVASTQTTLVTVTGTPSTPSQTSAAASAPAATVPLGTGSSGAAPTSAPAAGGSTTCSTDGAIVCNGPTQFGICDHGSVVWQQVAAGTTCSNGSIQKRGYRGRVVRRNRSLFSHAHKY